jgi:PhoH-like ATPase
VKADAFGVPASDYENSKVDVEKLYTGSSVFDVDHSIVEEVYSAAGVVSMEDAMVGELEPNHCVTLRSKDNIKQAVLCRYDHVMKRLERLPQDLNPSGLKARSAEQQFALDLLCDPNVELVTLVGLAGSGKTLMAVAAGLHGVLEDKIYKKLLLLKPVVSMDNSNDIGFLPGSMEDKLAPWIQSYHDNIDFLMSEKKPDLPKASGAKRKYSKKTVEKWDDDDEKDAGRISLSQELVSRGFMEVGSLQHLRGRTLPAQYIIVDESQNLTPAALKTVISRAGEGSKIVLLGDIRQVDNPYLSADTNGLTYVIDRFKNEDLSGHLTLVKSERSRLAERAAELL